MRNSLTRFRVSLEGLTFGLLEMIHWSRFRIIDLSIAGTLLSVSLPQIRSPPSLKKRLNAATITPGPKFFPVGHATQTSSPSMRRFRANGIALGKILYKKKLE